MGRYAYGATSAKDFARGASDQKKVFVVSVPVIRKLKTSMSAERQREGKSMRLIDKDALIAEYDRVHVGEPGNARKLIENAPTIEQRKTGKWIDYIGKDLGIENQWLRDDGKTVFVQCDQCKSLYVRNFMSDWHWCPRCGCKMEGEQP